MFYRAGCEDVREEKVYSQLTPENFLTTNNGKLAVLYSAYGNVQPKGHWNFFLSPYSSGEAWNQGKLPDAPAQQPGFCRPFLFFNAFVNLFEPADTRKNLIVTEYVNTSGQKMQLLGNNQSLWVNLSLTPTLLEWYRGMTYR